MKKLIILPVACAVTLFFVAFSHAKTGLLMESFVVEAGGTLYLDTDAGSIELESHDQDTVDITVELKDKNSDNFSVKFSQNGNDVLVIGDKKKSFSFGRSSGHFIVKVPRHYDVDLKTHGGSITLSSLIGKVDAYTSGGSIGLSQIQGDVDMKTSGGSIRVDGLVGSINAHTSGGSISVQFSEQPTADSKLTTSGGGITAYLIPTTAVDLFARTSGGSVASEFKVTGSTKRTKVEGTINGGGPKMVLKTSGGSVRVKEL